MARVEHGGVVSKRAEKSKESAPEASPINLAEFFILDAEVPEEVQLGPVEQGPPAAPAIIPAPDAFPGRRRNPRR